MNERHTERTDRKLSGGLYYRGFLGLIYRRRAKQWRTKWNQITTDKDKEHDG